MTTKPILQTGCAEIVSPGTIVSNHAVAYRFARRKGELILQGAYRWQQGSMSGFEWRDIPTIELDEPEPEPEPESDVSSRPSLTNWKTSMTTDFRALCTELHAAFNTYAVDESHHALLERARAALADEPTALLPLADTHCEERCFFWELEDAEGEWRAGGTSNSQSDVEREGMRYLQTHAQHGPHKLIIRQHTTQIINEITK